MTSQERDNLNEIGRMIALAERFAGKGQMNLNKTLEAMAYARYDWLPGTNAWKKESPQVTQL